ncbi:hypothetical protein ACHAW5_009800 [Stephanodiscus triporus]|uniref:Uncharacterized protein n=1 Tax=Stephanodiscus triporus TaxID=2934178 RepID=A0ABD3NWV5_9STRA
MIAKKILWKSSKSSPESKQDDVEEKMSQYNLCVEEIKNEGKVLGSLEFHEEAMRRMNQRLHKDCAPSRPSSEEGRRDKFTPDRVARRPKYIPSISEGASSAPPRRGNALTRSITLMVTGKHGHAASDPSKEKMPGRRTSALTSVEFDEGVTAAQVLQDIDLSDSESEAAGPPTLSPGRMAEGGGKSVGRRGSFLTGSSSRIGRPMRTAVRRFSKRRSLDLSESEDEGVGPTTHSPTHSPGRPVDSGGNSGGGSRSFMRRSSSNLSLPQWIAVSRYSRRRSSASIDGDDHVLSSKTHDDANEREENVKEIKSCKIDDGKPEPSAAIDLVGLVLESHNGLQTHIDADEHAANLEEKESYKTDDMKPAINDQAEKSDTESMLSWRSRIGKRRSSLFSVNERRPTVDSMREGSFNGSLAGESRDGSLICSFRTRNSLSGSYVEDGTLICDWGRRHSDSDVQSIQEGLLNGIDEKASSGSLICGWDRSDRTILSHSSVKADRSAKNSR